MQATRGRQTRADKVTVTTCASVWHTSVTLSKLCESVLTRRTCVFLCWPSLSYQTYIHTDIFGFLSEGIFVSEQSGVMFIFECI